MKRPQGPCRGCDKRYVGCHAECEIYKRFQSELEAWKMFIKQNSRPAWYWVNHGRSRHAKN